MLNKISENFYINEEGNYCIIGENVPDGDRFASHIGLDRFMRKGEVVVCVGDEIAERFKKIELKDRLHLYAEGSSKYTPDSFVPLVHGRYYISGTPLTKEELDEGGIGETVGKEQSVVTFSMIYRSGIAQNEINLHFIDQLSGKTRFFKPYAVRFNDVLLSELGLSS